MAKLILFFVAVFGVAILLLDSPTYALTSQPSSWLKPENPSIKLHDEDLPLNLVPAYSNKSCIAHTEFVTIPEDLLRARPKVSHEACAIGTSFGQHSASSSTIKLAGSSIAGLLRTESGGSIVSLPIPNSRHVLIAHSSGYSMIRELQDSIKTVSQPNGSIEYRLKPATVIRPVTDSKGAPLQFSDMRFSDNGQWLVGDIPNRGMTRYNIETGESLMFGGAYNYSNGIAPHFVSAISGDGRYALAAENSYSIIRIYDLSTCTPSSNPTQPTSCQFKDVLSQVNAQISNFRAVHFAQFSTNYTIRFYAKYVRADSSIHFSYYSMTAAGETESLLGYLALGDSFASGEGAHTYRSGTDVEDPLNKCHLSLFSYPYLVAAATQDSAQSIACSGAKTKDIIDHPLDKFYKTNESQAQGKSGSEFNQVIYNDYLPGYRPQIDFVGFNKPQNITISIGGNDMGFTSIIKACAAPGTCYTDPYERLNLTYTINEKFGDLVQVYQKIKDEASTGANIYTLGYPHLVMPNGNCAVNVLLDEAELVFANELVSHINTVVRSASEKVGVTYIDVERVLTGHRLCEGSNLAVNGVTAGDDKTASLPIKPTNYVADFYLLGRESYHPNKLGHQLFAQEILRQTNGFRSKNPQPVPSTSGPTLTQHPPILGGSTPAINPRKIIFYNQLSDDTLITDSPATVSLRGTLPGSNFSARLRSPTNQYDVGSGQSSPDNPNATARLVIDKAVKVGIYTLEIAGKTPSNEDVLIQKTVYVGRSANDFDGDGILNSHEKCVLVDAANIDTDHDGVDDACDGMIVESLSSKPSIETPTSPASTTEQNTNTTPLSVQSPQTTAVDPPITGSGVAQEEGPAMATTFPSQVRGTVTELGTHTSRPTKTHPSLPSGYTNKWITMAMCASVVVGLASFGYIKWRSRA